MADGKNEEREYYRAPARLMVRYGPDTPEGRQAMAIDVELWRTQSQLEEAARAVKDNHNISEELQPLLAVIRWLDFKVDMVLHHLRARDFDQHFPQRLETCDISGSGLGVGGDYGLTLGQTMIMAITLPSRPWQPVYARGEVIRGKCQAKDGAPHFGVKFLELAEADMERLIRFTFEQQRRQLARRVQESEA